MDFIDQIKQLSQRIDKMKDTIQTEEATKTSMIMPFFQMLGYDVFNPLEFVPEYTADVGIKKGEKVDYAIIDEEGKPLILIEAKWCKENLDRHGSQLFRYFATTKAKFGILTNGIVYRFYTDLEEQNKMDEKPFLELNLSDLKESIVPELKKFQKSSFDVETILTTASELKYNRQIKQLLTKQLADPTDDFVSCLISDIYTGRKTQKIMEDFHDIVKKSFNQFINEQINDRLKTALGSEDTPTVPENGGNTSSHEENNIVENEDVSKIITTKDEIESYFIIKTLLHDVVGDNTVTYKDTENYFGILLNNNIRKWICRLQLGDRKWNLIIPDENKNYIKHPLNSLDDIYKYKDALHESVCRYLDK